MAATAGYCSQGAPLDAPGDSVQHEAAKFEPEAAMNIPATSALTSGPHGAV
jgi:hypothetical protein